MRKQIWLIFLLLSAVLMAQAQTLSDLYAKGDFKGVIKFANHPDQLSADELYMVGFAYFQLADDQNAIVFFDQAIGKGIEGVEAHFYKGISLRYQKKYAKALEEIELALQADATNQEYMNEKGMVYFDQKKYDEALKIFLVAKSLPNTFPEPYFWIARICLDQGKYQEALPAFYEAVGNLDKDNTYYGASLAYIGQLEYKHAKNYPKSIAAFEEEIRLDPEDYPSYYGLIMSYNAAQQYDKAESLFVLVKAAFDQGKLPKEDMEIKTISVARFVWNDQVAVIRRSLVDPEKTLDISYKVFLLDAKAENIVRRFVVEKTIQLGKKGAKHLLCEQVKETGADITYPYGWETDDISVVDLENAVRMVLDGEIKAGASSRFGK